MRLHTKKILPRRRGTILIVALGIMLILAGLVVTLAHSMGVEATASANYSAAVQAAAVERGAEQYVIGMLIQLQQEQETFYDLPDSDFAAVKIGNGYFWIVRPNYPNDPEFSQYGLVDESAKININALSGWNDPEAGLMALPGMTQDAADALLDWTGEKGGVDNSSYYGSLPTPYQSKQSAFETVEELLLVNGFTRELLYGQSVATAPSPTIGLGQQNGIPQTPTLGTDAELVNGIADYLTVYSLPSGGSSGQTPVPINGPNRPVSVQTPATVKINIVDAPREVLVAFMEGNNLSDSVADEIIGARNLDDPDIQNIQQQAPELNQVSTSLIGGPGYQFSADIVAVSGNGRAFKRVKVVIDASQTTPTIIYRRDFTNRGWPLDPEILTNLRAGQPVQDAQDISQVGSSI